MANSSQEKTARVCSVKRKKQTSRPISRSCTAMFQRPGRSISLFQNLHCPESSAASHYPITALPGFSGSRLVYGPARPCKNIALPGGQTTCLDFSNSTARPKMGLRTKWLISQSGLPGPSQMAVQQGDFPQLRCPGKNAGQCTWPYIQIWSARRGICPGKVQKNSRDLL